MSSETPIYDATCRDVGSPDDTDESAAVGERSARPTEPLATADDDAVTSDLRLGGAPAGEAERS
ncbi:hypothetical protein EV188_10177 [Actinomycetospora succinea]|uniref:Uncharacterized protein n=1 Tax=Actinomycetospora succinea TaxID=663603 RepID=A0A4R6VQX2_9PSEU|nr:hypothetical protein [Actinomycetospora succinea]TDQ64830.1 hypothetical protein EV188_10177 [Actinomycetospora succinea]